MARVMPSEKPSVFSPLMMISTVTAPPSLRRLRMISSRSWLKSYIAASDWTVLRAVNRRGRRGAGSGGASVP